MGPAASPASPEGATAMAGPGGSYRATGMTGRRRGSQALPVPAVALVFIKKDAQASR